MQSLLEENLPTIIPKYKSKNNDNKNIFSNNNNTDDNNNNYIRDFVIFPLYASLPPDEQMKIFTPVPKGIIIVVFIVFICDLIFVIIIVIFVIFVIIIAILLFN